jgi:hypothetical protein
MTTSAVLDDLIDALEEQSDSLFPFLDRQTGEVLLISDESLSLSEAEPEEIALLPDWQKEEAELAVLIESTDRYLRLPTRFDVHEWNIMPEFCHQVRRDDIRERLLGVIHGNQAFAASRIRSRPTICGKNGMVFAARHWRKSCATGARKKA